MNWIVIGASLYVLGYVMLSEWGSAGEGDLTGRIVATVEAPVMVDQYEGLGGSK